MKLIPLEQEDDSQYAVVECFVVISLAVKSSCLAKVVFGFCLSGLPPLSLGKGSSGIPYEQIHALFNLLE